MKNICYIVSGIDKALAFEWISQFLDASRFRLHFILLHSEEGELQKYLQAHEIPHLRISYAGKADLPKAVLQMYTYLKKEQIKVVHCHLVDAGLAGLTAARLAGISNRIYSRHSSTFHHVYFPKGVLYDRYINFLSTTIVAVSGLVKRILVQKEQVSEEKITVIHHGFPLQEFYSPDKQVVERLKEKYHLANKWPVIGVISRYTEWKGIQYILPAFKELLRVYPNAHLVLANARGNYKPMVQQLLSQLPEDSYTEIPFENELFGLYHCFHFFVHTPIDDHSEAFGQVYIEAMAAGVPCVFTISGIAHDVIKNGENALVTAYKDTTGILNCLNQLVENSDLQNALIAGARTSVFPAFELQTMIRKLEQLYE